MAIDDEAAQETIDTIDGIIRSMTVTKALYAVLLFFACLVVMKIIMTVLDRGMRRLKIDTTVHKFARSCLKVIMWLITILIVAGFVGLPVQSMAAVLGVIGVALILALQGSLSDLAGGIMVMVSRPFTVEDFVEVGGLSGTVLEIGLVYTKLRTFDNKIIFVPNGEVSKEKIVNYSIQKQRRVDLTFNVAYEADPEQVKSIIREIIGAHPKALFTPEPFVRTTALNDSNVGYTLRVWCGTEDYWDLYYDLLEQIRAAFGQAGIEFTYNHLNVHMIGEE